MRERKPSSDSAGAAGTSGTSGSGTGPGPSDASASGSSASGTSGSPDGSGASDSGGTGGRARERARTRTSGDRDGDRDNPFAPPPADAPDQPWQPRHHGQDQGRGHDGDDQGRDGDQQPPAWGSQWSSRQPGRQSGGFGTRPGNRNGQQGPGGQGGPGGSLRWDPTDPAQRRARYALLAGMWGFFFVLFNLPEIALLLATLALYWGISSLRAKPARPSGGARATAADVAGQTPPRRDPGASATGHPAAASTRPQTTAAVAGLVTASLALVMVAATFTLQLVYRDYFTCVNDALTRSAAHSCEKKLPEQLRPLLSIQQE
ncbi:membrane protein [Streptomyces rimosus subsp. rimosus]|nr:membrane protein [Streptomyces rimosus subsp. rimosus]